MPTRRDVLKGTVAGVIAGALSTRAEGQEEAGPLVGTTAKFTKAGQEKLPPWAFSRELPTPPTIRPRMVAAYADLLGKPAFGPTDRVPIGDVFHGTACEWAETPAEWHDIGCTPTSPRMMSLPAAEVQALCGQAWEDKKAHFGRVLHHSQCGSDEEYEARNEAMPTDRREVANWGQYPVKCYKQTVVEGLKELRQDAAFPARLYTYGGHFPAPIF